MGVRATLRRGDGTRIRGCSFLCAGLAALFLGATPTGAQEAATPEPARPAAPTVEKTTERDLPAVRLSRPPVIDGDLSDPVWKEAARTDHWVDWLNGNPNIDQTAVSVGYDDRNLYFAWYAYDSQPQGIVARQNKRGAFPAGDDWIDLNLDLFHTHKFGDNVFSANLGARVSDPFHNYGLGYSWGRRAGDAYRFITPYATCRFGERLTLGLASSLLFHTEDAQQHIFTFNYDFSPRQGIGGRVVAQTGGTNGYFSYRRSGYGGMETFLIVGDPNAKKFRPRLVLKVVWAI